MYMVHVMSKQVPLNYLSERLLHLATLTRGVNTKQMEAVRVGMAIQKAPSDISHQLHAMALRPAGYFSFTSAATDNQSPLSGVESFSILQSGILQKLYGQLPGLLLRLAQLCIQKGSQDKRHLQGQGNLLRATRNESK